MKYITRMDSGATHGWWVRVGQNKEWGMQQFFPGKESDMKVLRAAKTWRDKTVKKLSGKLRLLKNTTEDMCWGKGYFRDNQRERWTGHYRKNKKLIRRHFNVSDYGELGARRKAKRFRENGIIGKEKRV